MKKLSYVMLPFMIFYILVSSWAFEVAGCRGQSADRFFLGDNPFRYSGYYTDTESGLYYLNARYYSPELMRFMSRDSFDVHNRYAYCEGDPVSKIDPTGHTSGFWDKFISGITSSVAGFIAGGIVTCLASTLLGGILGGTVVGGISGAISGIATYAVAQNLPGGRFEFDECLAEMFIGLACGAIVGGVAGGCLTKLKIVRANRVKPFVSNTGEMEMTDIGTASEPESLILDIERINQIFTNKRMSCSHAGIISARLESQGYVTERDMEIIAGMSIRHPGRDTIYLPEFEQKKILRMCGYRIRQSITKYDETIEKRLLEEINKVGKNKPRCIILTLSKEAEDEGHLTCLSANSQRFSAWCETGFTSVDSLLPRYSGWDTKIIFGYLEP